MGAKEKEEQRQAGSGQARLTSSGESDRDRLVRDHLEKRKERLGPGLWWEGGSAGGGHSGCRQSRREVTWRN